MSPTARAAAAPQKQHLRRCRRWATVAASGTLALLFAASPSEAFLASHSATCPSRSKNCRSSSARWRGNDLCMSTVSPPRSAQDVSVPPSEGNDGGREASSSSERFIKEMKSGDKVIGYVADTTKFAAFVDVGVVRRGAKGKVVPVTGFLHLTDIRHPYALEGSPRAKNCEVEVKKGIHLTAYVKDVFPNAGRLTLSLDPRMSKDKVLKLRERKRQKSRTQRRERLAEKGRLPEVGDVVEGYVRQVQDTMLFVDVMYPRLSVLRVGKIRDALGGPFIKLPEKAAPGDTITVRVEEIHTNTRKGYDEKKAVVSFVGWGTLKEQEAMKDSFVRDIESRRGMEGSSVAAARLEQSVRDESTSLQEEA